MSARPSISVIVPAFQAERYLAATLESVLGQQGGHDVDVLVVDNASTDGTGEVAASFGDSVNVCRLDSNVGPSGARNAAVERTSGELIMFIDADDLWPVDAITQRLMILEDNPDLEVVAGSFTCVPDGFDDRIGRMSDYTPEKWWSFIPSSTTVRRSTFEAVGPFDPSLLCGEDTDWYLRARDGGTRILRDLRSHCLYRQHPDSLTASNRALGAHELFKTIRRNAHRAKPADS